MPRRVDASRPSSESLAAISGEKNPDERCNRESDRHLWMEVGLVLTETAVSTWSS